MSPYVDVAGWIGATLVLGAYVLHTTGRIRRPDGYQLANALGSAGLGAAATQHHNWPSAILNGLWLAVAATALWRRPARPAWSTRVPRSARGEAQRPTGAVVSSSTMPSRSEAGASP